MNGKKTVRIAAAALAVLATIVAAGCAAGPEKAPEVKNLVYELDAAPAREGGSTNVTGSINVTRRSGEIAAVNTAVYDASGKQVSANTIALADAPLRTSDSLAFGFQIGLSRKGDYTFRVSVTDAAGRQSNALVGIFRVTDVF